MKWTKIMNLLQERGTTLSLLYSFSYGCNIVSCFLSRVIDCLKEKVFESRRKTAFVDSKIQKLQLLMDRPPENKEITELKLRIQVGHKTHIYTMEAMPPF